MLSRREALALPLVLAGVAGPDAAASVDFDRQKWRPDASSAGRNVGGRDVGGAGASGEATDAAASGDAAGEAPREAEAFAAPAQPEIRPRSAWATKHPVRGTLVPEEDVSFLLVHHTLTPNTDTPEEIPGRIRSIYAFHTGERGWADVAYNFFVDPSGVVWEGREGSLAGPVQADATGGSQGFAQLACFIGDFTSVVPTPAAMDAMVRLLAWLAGRSGLSLEGTTTFVSRGSSKWARGVEVTTARVAAHRDMSVTECPGDALYPLVARELLPRAAELVAAGASAGTGAGVSPGAGESGTSGSRASASGGGTGSGASGDGSSGSGSSGSGDGTGGGGATGVGDATGGAAGGAEGSGWGRVALPGVGDVPVEDVVAGVTGVALAGGAVAWGVRAARGRSGRVGSAPEASARGSDDEGSAQQQQRDERQTADEQRDDQPDEEPGQGL